MQVAAALHVQELKRFHCICASLLVCHTHNTLDLGWILSPTDTEAASCAWQGCRARAVNPSPLLPMSRALRSPAPAARAAPAAARGWAAPALAVPVIPASVVVTATAAVVAAAAVTATTVAAAATVTTSAVAAAAIAATAAARVVLQAGGHSESHSSQCQPCKQAANARIFEACILIHVQYSSQLWRHLNII